MRLIITGNLAFALTFVALGLSQPAALLAAPETNRAPLAAQELGLGHTQPAVRLGGSPGGVIGDRYPIGEEIPQRA